jgi:hypothetical protein
MIADPSPGCVGGATVQSTPVRGGAQGLGVGSAVVFDCYVLYVRTYILERLFAVSLGEVRIVSHVLAQA